MYLNCAMLMICIEENFARNQIHLSNSSFLCECRVISDKIILSSSLLMVLYPIKSVAPGLIPVTEKADMGSWLHRSQGVTDKVNFACSLIFAFSASDFSLVLRYSLWLYLDYQTKSIHSLFITH